MQGRIRGTLEISSRYQNANPTRFGSSCCFVEIRIQSIGKTSQSWLSSSITPFLLLLLLLLSRQMVDTDILLVKARRLVYAPSLSQVTLYRVIPQKPFNIINHVIVGFRLYLASDHAGKETYCCQTTTNIPRQNRNNSMATHP